jgi:DNA-binding cell septation regulator SpoVG
MDESNIKVLKITRLPGDRSLKAYVDLQIGEWVVNDWRIVHRKDERVQVNYPSVSYRDAQGTIRYRALLSVPGELKQRIEVAILSAWEKERKNGSSSYRSIN